MIQAIIDILYRNPKSSLNKFKRFGGLYSYYMMIGQQKKMSRYALNLPVVNSLPGGLPVYFLTGVNYLYQTLFCIQSLIKVAGNNFDFYLVDDGSLTIIQYKQIKRLLPGSTIISTEEIAHNLNITLPRESFPNLYKKRKVYPHIKKITDIHTYSKHTWKLVLDSDMLFWKEPKEIINWLQNPLKPLFAKDCSDSYGYPLELIESTCGSMVPRLLNAGIIGFNSKTIDWQQLELWVKTLEAEAGTSYFLEQALTAMLIGTTNSLILSEDEYIVNPSQASVKSEKGILHHYVDLSKKDYYNLAWKQLIR